MTQPTNLAEIILEKSSILFREQGYTATTIKQIANAAGCTTAALYYYYEGGKTEILHEVIRSLKKNDNLITEIQGCGSLAEFINQLTVTLAPSLPKIGEQMGWLMFEFSKLPVEEKKAVQAYILRIYQILKERILCFTEDESKAGQLALIFMNALIGYHQAFFKTEINQQIDFDINTYGQVLAGMIEKSLK